MTGATKLERFSAGERFAVDPESIERELASLWRAAGATAESKHHVTRACLWNVVIQLEERPKLEGFGDHAWLVQAVRDLPQYLAARALVLRTMPQEANAAELESWISANCIVAEGGGKLVCSEEIALLARGDGERHLPALVRALLVPAVPTAMIFAAVPPTDLPPIEAMLDSASRMVAWADRSLHPSPLRRIAAVMSELPLGAIDLGWLALSSYRTLVASLFDPPATPEEVSAIERLTITAPRAMRWSVTLMLAWVAAALGGENPKPIGEGAWRFSRAGGRSIDAIFAENETRVMPDIELFAKGNAVYSVKPAQENLAEVKGPHVDAKKVLGRRSPAQLLARALRTRSEDRAFARALKLAGAMA